MILFYLQLNELMSLLIDKISIKLVLIANRIITTGNNKIVIKN
jgi:hypothetical protein